MQMWKGASPSLTRPLDYFTLQRMEMAEADPFQDKIDEISFLLKSVREKNELDAPPKP